MKSNKDQPREKRRYFSSATLALPEEEGEKKFFVLPACLLACLGVSSLV